jgi:hypothetical protein
LFWLRSCYDRACSAPCSTRPSAAWARLVSHADGLEDENRGLQSELASLLEARRDNDDAFTIRQWDESGASLVDTIASAQNLHVGRAAFQECL